MIKSKRLLVIIAIIFMVAAALRVYNYTKSNHNRYNRNKNVTEVNNKSFSKNNSVITDKANLSDNSIYQFDAKWINEYGKEVRLKDCSGNVQVVAMFFANCTYVCPMITEDMKKIEDNLKKSGINNVGFLLVSFDPERDKPKNLLEYSKSHSLDLNRWRLLTGKESNISTLAALLNFKLSKDEDGNFIHSNMITVLNKKGEIAYQHNGLGNDISDVVENVKKID